MLSVVAGFDSGVMPVLPSFVEAVRGAPCVTLWDVLVLLLENIEKAMGSFHRRS